MAGRVRQNMGALIKSITEYIDVVNKFRKIDPAKTILFRGQSNVKWSIQSSLERVGISNISFNKYYTSVDRYKPEINAYGKHFKRKVKLNGYDFSDYNPISYNQFPEMEYLTYLRHHGFPSPLIDFTQSEYIALFFACEDVVFSSGKTTNGKVFVMQSNLWENFSCGMKEIHRIGHYVETDQRHIVQQSEYLLACCYCCYSNTWMFVPFGLENSLKDSSIKKKSVFEIKIAAFAKKALLQELDKMNINHFTLYRDEDSLMKKMKFEFLQQQGLV